MNARRILVIGLTALSLALAGCQWFDLTRVGGEGQPCFGKDRDECRDGFVCADGECRALDECDNDPPSCDGTFTRLCVDHAWVRQTDCALNSQVCRGGECVEPTDGDSDADRPEEEIAPDGDEPESDGDDPDGDPEPETDGDPEPESDGEEIPPECDIGPCCQGGRWVAENQPCVSGLDQLDCTTDLCDASHECVHQRMADHCLVEDPPATFTCHAEGVVPLPLCRACDPSDDPAHLEILDDTGCDDGLFCTVGDTCDQGSCEGTPRDCSAEAEFPDCQQAECDEAADLCSFTVIRVDQPCDDFDLCTTGTLCDEEGECQGGTEVDCSRFNTACSSESCEPDQGCLPLVQPDACLIESADTPGSWICRSEDEKDPLNECRSCRPDLSAVAWSPLDDNDPCTDDGFACTDDLCAAGDCAHALKPQTCLIADTCHHAGDANIADACEVCDPERSVSDWSTALNDTPCEPDADPCSLDVCAQGLCTHDQPLPNDCGARVCGPSPTGCFTCGSCPDGQVCDTGACREISDQFVRLEVGEVTMGSPTGELGRDSAAENPEEQRAVRLTYAIEMMIHETTQTEFQARVGSNPSTYKNCVSATGTATCPVETVTWHQALDYANRLSVERSLPPCFSCTGAGAAVTCDLSDAYRRVQDCPGYRLPTEAEWEYAARAGTSTALFNGNLTQTGRDPLDPLADAAAWYGGNSGATYAGAYGCSGWYTGSTTCGPHGVMEKTPNAWGLYDLHGNVYEWVWDAHSTTYFDEAGTDLTGGNTGGKRIIKGGDWMAEAKALRSGHRNNRWATTQDKSQGFRLVRTLKHEGLARIRNGSFNMGTPANDPAFSGDETLHSVHLTRDFEMTVTEITQEAFSRLAGYNPSVGAGSSYPVENVSWHEAAAYANLRSRDENLTECYTCTGSGTGSSCALTLSTDHYDCDGWRLPTEAEWEYAARAGTSTHVHNGNLTTTDCTTLDANLNLIAWYACNASSSTHAVGSKGANPWGLTDMAGNVWEWIYDQYAAYPTEGETTDPTGGSELLGTLRVLRGGAYNSQPRDCRHANRHSTDWTQRSQVIGFRLVRTL